MKWQSIETAPKDGTAILVCQATDADGKPIIENFGLFVQCVSWWGGKDDGEWVVYCSMPDDPQCFFIPTHWMPIPDPPDVG